MDYYQDSIISVNNWGNGLSIDSAAFSIYLHYGVIGAIITLFVVRKVARHYRKKSIIKNVVVNNTGFSK